MTWWGSNLLEETEDLNYRTIALISHASKVMLKIPQARLQQYVNHELPDVQAGFRKGRGTRDQIANIRRVVQRWRRDRMGRPISPPQIHQKNI